MGLNQTHTPLFLLVLVYGENILQLVLDKCDCGPTTRLVKVLALKRAEAQNLRSHTL